MRVEKSVDAASEFAARFAAAAQVENELGIARAFAPEGGRGHARRAQKALDPLQQPGPHETSSESLFVLCSSIVGLFLLV